MGCCCVWPSPGIAGGVLLGRVLLRFYWTGFFGHSAGGGGGVIKNGRPFCGPDTNKGGSPGMLFAIC